MTEGIDASFFSLIPPCVAILLALLTKEIVLSLFVAICSGIIVYTGLSDATILSVPKLFVQILSKKFAENMELVVFLALLGSLVAVVTRAGGAKAYGRWATTYVKTERSVNLMTVLMGFIIFIDDYFNCLTVGTVMRPLADKYKISRAKLAYFLDTTAAPICILVPVSSWSAYVISCLPPEMRGNGMSMFMKSAPLNFYAIMSLIMIFWVALRKNSDFGLMARMEKSSHKRRDVGAEIVMRDGVGEIPESPAGRVYDLIAPIIVLIASSLWLLRRYDSGLALALGALVSLVFSFILLVPRKIIGYHDFSAALLSGIKTMVPAIVLLSLAWGISYVCNDLLHTGDFIASAIVKMNTSVMWLPVALFVVSAAFSFCTGASWAALGIIVPIGMSVCLKAAPEYSVLVLASTLSGAVVGDHCSPIADTTILASAGAGCKHLTHVMTQMPYAVFAGIFSSICYAIAGCIMFLGYAGLLIFSLASTLAFVMTLFFASRIVAKGRKR